MKTVEQIKAAYEAFVEENEKFVEKGNKAAAGRARKALMELAKLCKVRRAEILEEKKQFHTNQMNLLRYGRGFLFIQNTFWAIIFI